MKRTTSPKKRNIVIFFGVLLLVILTFGVLNRARLQRYYLTYQAKTTLAREINKVSEPLTAIGFNTKDITTECSDNYSLTPDCSAIINSYIVVGNDHAILAGLSDKAAKLSTALDANGWQQRPDLLTTPWFAEISKGTDYQPDQLNTKQVGDFTCMIDFTTAFSQPAPAAINMQASCYKTNPISPYLDLN